MTNQELEYLLSRVRHGTVPLDQIDGGGAETGDTIVWDGEHWVPVTPPPPVPGGNIRGLDVTLNFSADSVDNVAVITHGFDSTSISLQLLTTAFDGLWATFLAPWRILDSNRVEVRANLGFTGPARAILQAIL